MALKMLKPQLSQPAVLTETVAEHNAVQQAAATVKVDSVQAVSEVEALTQEYIILYKRAEEHDVKNLVKRMEEIRKTLVAVANDTMDAKKPAIFACKDGEMEFSERGTDTIVPQPMTLLAHLKTKFGGDVANSVAKIGITELRKVLSPLEMVAFVEEKDGARTLKAVRPAANA